MLPNATSNLPHLSPQSTSSFLPLGACKKPCWVCSMVPLVTQTVMVRGNYRSSQTADFCLNYEASVWLCIIWSRVPFLCALITSKGMILATSVAKNLALCAEIWANFQLLTAGSGTTAARHLAEAQHHKYMFWDTQPVPKIS